jgi:hypothetical protein
MTSRNSRSGVARANAPIALLLLGAVVAIVVTVLNREPRESRDTRTGARYAEEARKATAIDPALVSWEEKVAPRDIPMDHPVAIAVGPGDAIHIVGNRLVILEPDGSLRHRSEELEEAYRAVAVNDEGHIFAAASGHVDRLEFHGSELKVSQSFQLPLIEVGLASIALGREGVFVADAVGRRILRIPPGENEFEPYADGFNVPSVMDITVTPGGDLVTVDPGRHLVQVRDAYGDVVESFGEGGNGVEKFHGCCNPAAIAILDDGRWVSAEKGMGTTRVKLYSHEGVFEGVIATPEQFDVPVNGPTVILDVAVDSRNRVLVLDPVRKQVRTFTPKGEEGERSE